MDVITHFLLALLCLCLNAQSTDDGSSLVSSIYYGGGGGGDSTATPTGTGTSPATSSSLSSTQDNNNNNNNNNNDNRDIGGLVNYYFVFLALFVIIAGIGAFFMYRRKKKAMSLNRHGQFDALQQDVHLWDPTRARRRYWQGSRWQSADDTDRRAEGLNENGEAPPPYVPKGRCDDEEANHNHAEEELAVPMQTLSREQAGLKPPGYEEHYGGHTGATSFTASDGIQQTGTVPQLR